MLYAILSHLLFWTILYCRSLAACEVLYNAGYRNIFWVQGGLEAAEEEVFVMSGQGTSLFL